MTQNEQDDLARTIFATSLSTTDKVLLADVLAEHFGVTRTLRFRRLMAYGLDEDLNNDNDLANTAS